MVQLSHPYMTTGKTIVLTIWSFGGKVMSLILNTLSRFVIVFLPRSKCFLISRLQSPFPAWVSPLELRESHRGWMKAVPCNQINGGHKGLVSRSPTESCMVSHPSQIFLPCQHLTNLLFLHLKKYKSCLLWSLLLGPILGDLHAHKLLFSSTNLFCINLIIRAAKRT